MRIKVVTHYGSSYINKELELEELTYDNFLEAAYPEPKYRDNQYVKACYESLKSTGEGSFGWDTFTVI